MTTQPRRRWISFSLRTLFAVVTVACVALGWLVWQIQVVRERNAVLSELQVASGENFSCLTVKTMETEGYKMHHYARVPLVRRLLRDEAVYSIVVPQSTKSHVLRRMEIAFPESELTVDDLSSPENREVVASRDCLYKPASETAPNRGSIFKTGLIERPPDSEVNP